MRIKILIATGATSALLLIPALALAAGGPPANPGADRASGTSQGAAHATPGPHASAKAKAKAYGTYCAEESRKHVAGQKGTPFSQCVTAMAKLATGKTDKPRTACKGLSKKHVAGQHGTPFSQCVSAAAKLKDDQQSGDDTSTTTTDATA